MAFCLAEVCHLDAEKKVKINKWKVFNIDLGNIEKTSSLMIEYMKLTFKNIHNNKNTYVIVERQVPTNYNCFCLSYVVWAYFMSRFDKVNVSFIGANTKPIVSSGKKRKRESVVNAQDILKSNGEHELMSWLAKQSKKDDLTDAYLQIIGNLDKIVYHEEEQPNVIVIDD